MAPASTTTSADSSTPKLQVPEGNDNALQAAAAPIATISSHADPYPHYIMSGACECEGGRGGYRRGAS